VHPDLDTLVIALYVRIDETCGPTRTCALAAGGRDRPEADRRRAAHPGGRPGAAGLWLRGPLAALCPHRAWAPVPVPAAPVGLYQAAAGRHTAAYLLHPRAGGRHRAVGADHVGGRLDPIECGRSRQTVKRSALAGWAAYGYCPSHSRSFWGLRLHLVTTLDGLPVAFALTNPKTDEREVLVDLFDVEPGLLAGRAGVVLLVDKGYRDAETEAILAARGVTLLRPAYKGEAPRPGQGLLRPLRQRIESVNQTFKGQLDLERHGGRTIEGVTARVLQRLLALTAAIWHNHHAGASRSCVRCSPTTTDNHLESIV
jgi:Transposase DDE domain